MLQRTFVIVGAGLAGATAAEALRKEGFDGRIVLIGDEPHRPYERPELSKRFLRGEADVDVFVHGPDVYANNGIELRLGQRVDRIDLREREVVVNGEPIPFDRLLLATGASPRRLLVPGGDLDGVVTLRTIDNATEIRERAARANSIVVVGGGWIGSEVAASLRQLGHEPTLVVADDVPLRRVLGPDVGAAFLAAHRRNGTKVITERAVSGLDGHDRVEAVRLDDGSVVSADLVVVGIGAQARDELAAASGIAMANGVLTDERLQTSGQGIFAAGDLANAFHPRYGGHVRVEHWDNA
jgi:3-phenylpropionate/trans-cinnamate dioxygenase ferredoxin reductase subunit